MIKRRVFISVPMDERRAASCSSCASLDLGSRFRAATVSLHGAASFNGMEFSGWLRRHFTLRKFLSDLTGFVRLELYLKRPENLQCLAR
jgi:hypothetical protein